MTALEVPATERLEPIGAPILPGGTEAQIRRMTFGRFYITDIPDYGLAVASPYWIAPAATVAPILAGAGLELKPGTYESFTGRSTKDRPKIHRLDTEPPSVAGHVERALSATMPVYHQLHSGLPVIAGSWEKGDEGQTYVLDAGFGLKVAFLDWITGSAQPEDRVELCRLRCDEGVYRVRSDGDATKPVAIWVEQYLNARYLSSESKRTVSRRTLFVLMPVRFPKQ